MSIPGSPIELPWQSLAAGLKETVVLCEIGSPHRATVDDAGYE